MAKKIPSDERGQLQCRFCGYKWYPQRPGSHPTYCAGCKRAGWDASTRKATTKARRDDADEPLFQPAKLNIRLSDLSAAIRTNQLDAFARIVEATIGRSVPTTETRAPPDVPSPETDVEINGQPDGGSSAEKGMA